MKMAGTGETSEVVDTQENNEFIESGNAPVDRSERIVKLPLTRIKYIIKQDPDVTLASQDAVVIIAKATELFVQDLAKEAYGFTTQGKRKTVQKKDLDLALEQVDALAFLEGTLDS